MKRVHALPRLFADGREETTIVKKAAQATPNRLLRAARLEQGWTQQQVADRIGAPLALNVSRWENGTAFPSAYYLERLCQLFGKTVRDLGLSHLEDEMQAQPTPRPAVSMEHRRADAALQTLQREPVSPRADPNLRAFPYPRNPFFLGREDLLAQLHQHLHSGRAMALSQPQALSGLGGVGKTQVALEYAYRHAQDYQVVFWMRADSRDALAAGFLDLARVLHLPERDERDQAVIVAAVKGWLREHANWLLILDNADTPALLPDYLSSPLPGHLLLTTRAQALGGLGSRIEVDALDLDTAPLLLLRRAGLLAIDAPIAQAEQTDWQAAVRLSQELGGLPLALDQAGAYLEETQCSLQQYLDLYRSHRMDLLRRRGGMMTDHPDSVATTWSLSFAQVEQRSALAADLLRLCAWLHPDAIPEEFFPQAAAHLGPALAVLETDPLAFNQALAVIQSYSLLRRSRREQTLSIHRLMQAVLQDAMPQQERDQWIGRAIAAFDAIFPEVRHQVWGHWETCSRFLPHVLTLAALTSTQEQSLELATLLTKSADYLLQRAQFAQAEPLYQRALHIIEARALGSAHLQITFPLNGLAEVYREQGRFAEAEPLYRRALQIEEQAPGSKHPEIPYTLTNLAILYAEQGRYAEAEPLLQRALQFWEQMPDSEHSTVASALNNLAVLYAEQGHFAEAEPLLQRALNLHEQMFDPEHPEIAYALSNLADLYREQGRFAEAEPLYQRALHIREQKLGSTHPQVAFPLNGLADLYREQGRFAEAEPLYQRALTIRRQQRGDHHLETAESLHGYARNLELQSQPDQALLYYQQALAIREQHLGREHPHTQDTRTRCVHLLHARGRSEEAAALE